MFWFLGDSADFGTSQVSMFVFTSPCKDHIAHVNNKMARHLAVLVSIELLGTVTQLALITSTKDIFLQADVSNCPKLPGGWPNVTAGTYIPFSKPIKIFLSTDLLLGTSSKP